MTGDERNRRDSRALEPELIVDPQAKAVAEARNGFRQYDAAIGAIHSALERGSFKLRPSLILGLQREALAGISPGVGGEAGGKRGHAAKCQKAASAKGGQGRRAQIHDGVSTRARCAFRTPLPLFAGEVETRSDEGEGRAAARPSPASQVLRDLSREERERCSTRVRRSDIPAQYPSSPHRRYPTAALSNVTVLRPRGTQQNTPPGSHGG